MDKEGEHLPDVTTGPASGVLVGIAAPELNLALARVEVQLILQIGRGSQVLTAGPPPPLSPNCTAVASSPSQVHQNYHRDCEAAINWQINLALDASYVYLSMSYYFDRDDVALKNFAKCFLHQSREEREHAEKPMKLQNQRGGRIFLQGIKKPLAVVSCCMAAHLG
uniref:ferritin heavy chain-like n=1 Tax=Euleptes europaea TaxID=460621 RepID=UPI0025404D5D|nr:ferritin heavy chain-like [Euleptes europaea]